MEVVDYLRSSPRNCAGMIVLINVRVEKRYSFTKRHDLDRLLRGAVFVHRFDLIGDVFIVWSGRVFVTVFGGLQLGNPIPISVKAEGGLTAAARPA